MTSTAQFVAQLHQQGITPFVRDEKLRTRAEPGAMTAEIEQQIRARKEELIAFLGGTGQIVGGPAATIPALARGAPFPLSFAQQRLWFFEQMEAGTATYNVALALRMSGVLDLAAFRRSFQAIVDRHESLRTHVEQVDGRPVQVPHAALTLDIPLLDWSHLDRARQEHDLPELAATERFTPFDLARPPLLRVRLVKLAEREHILMLTVHHIVSDGWSQGVLIREFATLYAAYTSGVQASLPALPIQYADYAAWQREPQQTERIDGQLRYWKDKLAGLAPLLELPTDRLRPSAQSYRGATCNFELGPAAGALATLCRARGATLYMGLLAIFNILLYRYSGVRDIAVGSPVANRPQRELEGLIGAFSNTVVMRSSVQPEQTFLDYLDDVRKGSLEAYENQDVPFDQLVEALQPERSLSHAPLVQVKLVLENAHSGAVAVPGLTFSSVSVENPYAKFDLLLSISEAGSALYGALEYASDLFDDATIVRMAGHFQQLMASAVAAPASRIGDLTMLAGAEREQLVVGWNSERSAVQAQPMHALVEAVAARDPARVALVHEGARMGYGELNERANQLARHLQAGGARAGDRLGLCVERSFDLIVGMMAASKLGAAYVPIDPSFPQDHIRYLIADAQLRIVMTHARLLSALPLDGVPAVCLDVEQAALAAHSTGNLALAVDPEAIAYIIYTSGSTGRPKGVCIAHRSLCNYIDGFLARVPLSDTAQLATLATIGADLGNTAIFGAIGSGRTLRLLPQAASLDAELLVRSLRAEPIDCLKIVPSHLAGLLVNSEPAAILPRQALVCGGEALKFGLVSQVNTLAPDCRVFNHYGPTETTIGTVMREVPNGSAERDDGVPIGRPFANTQAYVLDEQLNPVPPGIPGQLYIGGAGVGHGYWRQPGLTAAVFTPDPFGSRPGGRLYATGDKVRMLADGTIVFLGRTDFQLNIRGFRVEPHSVRAVLLQHPAVKDAAVVPQAGPGGEVCMAAHVVVEGEGASAEILLAHLRARLPEYMLPSGIGFLSELPLTLNGKLDQRALPLLDFAVHASDSDEPPATPTEVLVAECWQEVLEIAAVGRNDNFFTLGGHSLLAMLVVARLRRTCEVELSIQNMFEMPTVKALAACIDGLGDATAGAPALAPQPAGTSPVLSYAQQRLWFLGQLEGPSNTYNMPIALRVRGPLDTGALARSLAEIIRRHEVLRTCYVTRDGVVAPELRDMSGFRLEEGPPGLDAHTLQAQLSEECDRPFDLAADYMLRARLWQSATDEHVLCVVMHHIACDGWSLSVLVRELAALYAGAQLPALQIQYSDYAHWQRQWLSGGELARQLDYWRGKLAGASELLELPSDFPRPAQQDFKGADIGFELPGELAAPLGELARKHGATLFMTLLTAFKVVLAKYSGSSDITVGTPVAGRSAEELEPLIGFFINTLVMRTELPMDGSFGDALERVKATSLEAYGHPDLPYEQLIDGLGVSRSLAYAPLVQVMFSLQNLPDRELALPDLSLSMIPIDNRVAKFDISLILTESGGRISGTLEYSTALFSEQRMRRLLDHFSALLVQVTATPATRLNQIECLSAADQAQLAQWNASNLPIPAGDSVHAMFAAQAARTPDLTAVEGRKASYSYRTLNQRADQLANYLIERGCGAQARVAVCVERDADMIVALLAVFKAGAIYLPLDPNNPVQRIAYMLDDAKPALVLTQDALRGLFGDRDCVCIDGDWHKVAQRPALPAARELLPQQAAYIIYTSGSTGMPKGVLVPHSGLANLTRATQALLDIGAGDRVVQFAAQGFDVSMWEIFMTLCAGGCLLLAPKEELLPGPELSTFLREHRASHLALTASSLAALPQRDELPDLKVIISGGEVCAAELVRKWGPGRRFYNVYGPTEASVCTSMGLCLPDAGEPSIGHVFANVQAFILDRHLNRVAPGVAGELYVAGAGLAHGYWGRTDLTAAAFLPNPFDPAPGARMYRSGDRARFNERGEIEYLGRIDDQVKLRGFRIELGEIEAQLLQHEHVEGAALVLHGATPAQQKLVAYVVPAAGAPAGLAKLLRLALGAKLPAYMVPTLFHALDELPRTVNGKIDRSRLPAPSDDSAAEGRPYVAPATDTEIYLATLWGGLLGHERVGSGDDFFELGGHSLLATQVVSRVRDELGVEASVRMLFGAPTVAGFAELLDAQLPELDDAELAALMAQVDAMSEDEARALMEGPQ